MDNDKTEELCKYYAHAGGDKEYLLPLLQNSEPDNLYYLHLIRELGPICHAEVATECMKQLSDPKVGDRHKACIAREIDYATFT